MYRLTDRSVIQALCKKHGFSMAKGFGQNFLTNPGICPKLCDVAQIDAQSNVLEIGPGFGTLTQELAARAKKVVALEVDPRLMPVLSETLQGVQNVEVVQGDALKVDLAQLIAEHFEGPVHVCANLPYNITSPILMRLLEEGLCIDSITVMVQKEAAERITAPTGTRQAGAITYAVSYYSQARYAFSVSAGSFMPPPKVKSAVIHLQLRKPPPLAAQPQREKRMFSLIKAAFGQRRKTLQNAILAGVGLPKEQLAAALQKVGLLENARAEQLDLEAYIRLEEALWP